MKSSSLQAASKIAIAKGVLTDLENPEVVREFIPAPY
jgi:hypothetical protein